MEHDRQAQWRTCVQLLCGAGMAFGAAFVFLEDTFLFEFLPAASDATRAALVRRSGIAGRDSARCLGRHRAGPAPGTAQ